MAKKKSSPDAYAFLLAAGELDYLSPNSKRAHIEQCAQEFERLAGLNGTYKLLPSDFRSDVRLVLSATCDDEASRLLGTYARLLREVGPTDVDALREARSLCSRMSRYWPVRPNTLLTS